MEWAKELQSLAQAGLCYGHDVYDKERYQRIREISAEMMLTRTDVPAENIETSESRYFSKDELPPLAEMKCNEEQIRMCFEAYESEDWTVVFD